MHINVSLSHTFADIIVPVHGTCGVRCELSGSTFFFDSTADEIVIQIKWFLNYFLQTPYLFPLFDPEWSFET